MLEELWISQADVQRHLRSDKYRKILLVAEMAAEPPEIRFDTIDQSAGMERIEQALGSMHPGMSLMITDLAADPETRSDRDFVIVTSEFVQ